MGNVFIISWGIYVKGGPLDVDLKSIAEKLPLPSKDALLENYLKTVVAAAVLALVLWLMTAETFNAATAMLANFTLPLVLILGAMLLAYVIMMACSSDALMGRMHQSGMLESFNRDMVAGFTLSLLAFFLNILFIRWVAGKTALGMAFLENFMFFLMLLIIAMAFVLFASVLLKVSKLAELRAPSA